MAMRKFSLTVVTAADGSATAYSPYLSGYINQIVYTKASADSYTDGVDFTITADETGETIWTEANVNASVAKAPRLATHTTAGVAALYAAGGTAVLDKIALARDRVKIVLASGGDTHTGTFDIIVDDGR
jgi:hypothetical protein